jgi:hypothetical protein
MPIRITWTAPEGNTRSGPILGYVLYKKDAAGEIDIETDFLTLLPASPRVFDDAAYDRITLENSGYTYAISALNPVGEGLLSLGDFASFTFEEPIYTEDWILILPGTESPQYTENWEPSLPIQYEEDWNI